MAITWRPAGERDIEPGLSLVPAHRGDALVGEKAALKCWQELVQNPFFLSAVLEADPHIRGHRLVGFAAAVFVSQCFLEDELSAPRPDINSRIIASIHAGRSVLATRDEIARANAAHGLDVVVMSGYWRDEIFTPQERQEVHILVPTSFATNVAGYRIRRICFEAAADVERDFALNSLVYRVLAEFKGLGRTIMSMTSESARAVPASVGNVLFSYREPLLRLGDSDQELLLAACNGATDAELAARLRITLSAVKARWRSAIARIEESMPELVRDAEDREGRGQQKRHRVLAYVRSHPEELRPFDWTTKLRKNAAD